MEGEFYILGFETWGEANVSGPYANIDDASEALEDARDDSFIVQRVNPQEER